MDVKFESIVNSDRFKTLIYFMNIICRFESIVNSDRFKTNFLKLLTVF